jgi:hypothetical protein
MEPERLYEYTTAEKEVKGAIQVCRSSIKSWCLKIIDAERGIEFLERKLERLSKPSIQEVPAAPE